MADFELDAKTTAMVMIDLQKGIVGRPLQPHAAPAIMGNSAKLAAALRSAGGALVFVRVDLADMIHQPADSPTRDPNAPKPPAEASELSSDSGYLPGDIVVTKRSWGAFYGTELDQLLRRRGIRTIVIGGVATNIGVESTARAAYDRGYHLVFVEDAMSTLSPEWHRFAVENIFPRMGHVRSTEQVLAALK
jgi:nicotinamidase-related amidase